MTVKKSGPEWHGVPKHVINWFPTIASDRCAGCGICVTSCFRGVLAFDYEAGQAVAVTPGMCVVGCMTCACLCPEDAIRLPSRTHIQGLIKRHTVVQQSKAMLAQNRGKYDVTFR